MKQAKKVYNSLRVEVLKLYVSSTELFLFLIGCIGALTLLCAIFLFWVRQLLHEVSYLRLEFTNLKHDTELIISNLENELNVLKSYEVYNLSVIEQIYNLPLLSYTSLDFFLVGVILTTCAIGTISIAGVISLYYYPQLGDCSFIDLNGNSFSGINLFFNNTKQDVLVKLPGDACGQSISNYIQNAIKSQNFVDEHGNTISILLHQNNSSVMVKFPYSNEILSIGDIIRRSSENLTYIDRSSNVISIIPSPFNVSKRDILFQFKETNESVSFTDCIDLAKHLIELCSLHNLTPLA